MKLLAFKMVQALIGMVIINMFLSRPMTAFTLDTDQGMFSLVEVAGTRKMVKPRVMAFKAARCNRPPKVAGAIWIKGGIPPFPGCIEPRHWQFHQATIIAP